MIVSKNDMYNKIHCHNCWYIITVLSPDDTYECPCCGRKGKELVSLMKEYDEKLKEENSKEQ